MMEDELIRIWQSSPHQEQVKFEKSRLIIDLQSNLDRFHRFIKRAYISGLLSLLFAIPMFIYYAIAIPFLLTKIASVLIILWIANLLFVSQKTYNKKPDQFSMSYLEYLYQTKEYLETHKRLRETMLYWQILPALAFIFLFVLGFLLEEGGNIMPFILSGTFAVIISLSVYFFNKRYTRKEIMPQLDKVNILIEKMEE